MAKKTTIKINESLVEKEVEEEVKNEEDEQDIDEDDDDEDEVQKKANEAKKEKKQVEYYHKMADTTGMEFFHKSWSLVLSPKEDAAIESDMYNSLRHRSFFDLYGRATQKIGVYLHLTKEEFDAFAVEELPKKIYLYGSYRANSGVRIRCFGKIRRMTETEKEEFIELIEERLSGSISYDKLVTELKTSQGRELKKLIQTGNYYFFTPKSFVSHVQD
jgi:hypothetical protein